MALLPPHRDSYRPDSRSLPGSPFAVERSMSNYGTVGMSPRDVEEAVIQARMGIDGGEDNYHHAIPRFPHGPHLLTLSNPLALTISRELRIQHISRTICTIKSKGSVVVTRSWFRC
jgi:hypothetical protein